MSSKIDTKVVCTSHPDDRVFGNAPPVQKHQRTHQQQKSSAVDQEGSVGASSYYDTAPLRETLEQLVDFDLLNSGDVRRSVGAVNVETGNMTWFDSAECTIGPEHIMASGALPPGFPAIEIDCAHYWDGGLVSNTPLQYVLDERLPAEDLCVFQVDLFNARGELPQSVWKVEAREEDIRFSSRTRFNTDMMRRLHDTRDAARRLYDKLPPDMKDDPDARASMLDHWTAGHADAERTLSHPDWKKRHAVTDQVQVFDLCEL